MNKKISILFLLSVLILSTIMSVSAVYVADSVTFNNPIASGTVAGTYMLNVTNTTTFNTINNCTFYAKSSLTANSSWTLIAGPTANSSLSKVNASFNSAILEDANNYQFNATCRNFTNDITDRVVLNVVIDNTSPTTPTISPTSNTVVSSATTQTFTGTVVDRETTSCTYSIARGGVSSGNDYLTGAGTYSGTSCTFTKAFSTSLDNGEWHFTIIASDETNTTSSVSNILSVQLAGSGGGGNVIPSDYSQSDCIANGCVWNGMCYCLTNQNTTEKDYTWLWVIGVILLICGFAYYLTK